MSTSQIDHIENENRQSEVSDTVFLSLHQAAKMTGYHQDYLGQMARSGKLEARKVGRNWQTTKLAIDKMLGRVPADPEPIKSEPQIQVSLPVLESKSTLVMTTPSRVSLESPSSQPSKVAVTVNSMRPSVAPQLVVNKSVAEVESKPKLEQVVESKNATPVYSAPVVNQSKRHTVLVRRLINSPDAGPNLQEALAFESPVAPSRIKIHGTENKNTFHRLNKLNRDRVWIQPAYVPVDEKYSRTKKLSNSVLSEQSSVWPLRIFATSALAIFVAVGVWGWSEFLSNPNSSNTVLAERDQAQQLPDKMVAGESTVAPQLELNQGPGQSIIFAGKSEVVVNHPGTEIDSTVMVTFRGDYGGRYWVANQTAGQFTVKLSGPVENDTQFDYWVINRDQQDPP